MLEKDDSEALRMSNKQRVAKLFNDDFTVYLVPRHMQLLMQMIIKKLSRMR